MLSTAGQAARAAGDASASYRAQVQDLSTSRSAVQRDRADVQAHLAEALADAGVALLPMLAAPTVMAAAGDVGDPRLVAVFAAAEAEHAARLARLEALDSDPDFRGARLALEPTTGTLVTEMAETRANADALTEQVAAFDHDEDFCRLLATRSDPTPTGLRRWIGWFLLYGLVSERRTAACVARVRTRFDAESLSACLATYDHARASRDYLLGEVARLETEYARIAGLVAEHTDVTTQCAQYADVTLEALRRHLQDYLRRTDGLKEVRAAIVIDRRALRLALSTILALREKDQYLEGMIAFLTTEIAAREQVANKMDRVRRTWSRHSGKSLRADKTDWLIDAPAKKVLTTSRTIAHIDTMRRGVYGYDDYGAYDRVLDVTNAILLYDLIARQSDARFPGDAFACGVMPDVSAFRASCGHSDPAIIDQAFGGGGGFGGGGSSGAWSDTGVAAAIASASLVADSPEGRAGLPMFDATTDDGAHDDATSDASGDTMTDVS
jgi:hypothetical protein